MKKSIAFAIIGIIAASPTFVSAATAAELTAQLQSLLEQLAALKSQAAPTPAVTVISGNAQMSSSLPACPVISGSLSRGARGPEVQSLQRYLIAQKLLAAASDTGYFGSLTEGAVQKFQTERNIVSSGTPESTGWGAVGVRTRAAIAKECTVVPVAPTSCAVAPPPTTACATKWQANTDAYGCTMSYSCSVSVPGLAPMSNAFSATPAFGMAPLTTTFTTKITNPTSYAGGAYTIDYGDNTREKIAGCSVSGVCALDAGFRAHRYSAPGIFTARLLFTNRACPAGSAVCPEKEEVIASIPITVSATLYQMYVPTTISTTTAY